LRGGRIRGRQALRNVATQRLGDLALVIPGINAGDDGENDDRPQRAQAERNARAARRRCSGRRGDVVVGMGNGWDHRRARF